MKKGTDARRTWLKQVNAFKKDTTFSILSVDDLFKTKAVVLRDRVTSRDLFDLMYLMKHKNYTIKDIVDAIRELDQVNANDAIEVLTGTIPLMTNDPGL
ncbi:MAG: nucleotidyl transferase AbiEii/AbiGii toxin family protein [Proteobacteria bacterium]|nr:nucleotidyl transferase AbiEii/AbiGii toxin family protein [Pseudomonadota bacterium]